MMSFEPRTPQSPSQLSPKTAEPLASVSVNSSMSFMPSLPTPAHSVNGSNLPSDAAHDTSIGEDSPHKRKRQQEDVGGHEQGPKKVHMEDDGPSIENLHEEVGEKYLLLRNPLPATKIPLTEDLFELYGLNGIAKDVVRFLPNGAKNGMRKSYKAQIKKLNLDGHWDDVKKDWNDADGFCRLIETPQEDWETLQVRGKHISSGMMLDPRLIGNALNMVRGPIPKDKWDQVVLGEIAPDKVAAKKQSSSAKATAPSTPAASGAAPRTKAQGLAAQEAARPRRNGTKRSYGDSSFEGYGDGFDEETGPETGYSTGEGEGAGLKRRKKTVHSFQGSSRQQSYGPGSVGS